MRFEIEVPEERVGAILGREGENKKRIEEKCGCRISVAKNIVIVECPDSLSLMKVKNVITAISRGFSAEISMKLIDNEDLVFESIDLSQLLPEKAMQRILGRIIGKEGIMRRQIEDMLNVYLSIYDKFVSIIGEFENVAIAREAINMLINGAQHSTVIKFIERKKRDLKSEFWV
ncbi:MAG: KH domain-containing protein [Archaeoglobaceae archaeon]|nr:KH domain-containing protein [Archaeoglobaceae archaeon]MDW8117450.1 KH domain-containing protein [Archaeoglobaceae archaeon]